MRRERSFLDKDHLFGSVISAIMKVLLGVLVLAACAAARVSSAPAEAQPEDIGSPLTVAQCRAQCLQRVSRTACRFMWMRSPGWKEEENRTVYSNAAGAYTPRLESLESGSPHRRVRPLRCTCMQGRSGRGGWRAGQGCPGEHGTHRRAYKRQGLQGQQ